MSDRVIKVVKDWGRLHQKEDKAKSLKFLNQEQQQYDWENNNLEDAKGLVKSDIAHPNIPAKFPDIDLESEQPHHHHVIKTIKDSKNKCIYAAQHNASLDNLPPRLQECPLPLTKSTHLSSLKTTPNRFMSWTPHPPS